MAFSFSGGLSAAEGRRQAKALRVDREREHARKQRARLAELRAAIRGLRAERKAAMAAVVQSCRAHRAALKDGSKLLREELRRKVAEERAAARSDCAAAKVAARTAATTEGARRRDELRAERAYQAQLRDLAKRHPSPPRARRGESDDEVRANLPPELVPVFERARSHARATDRASRTENFLRWVEEDPETVLQIQDDLAQRNWARELRRHLTEERSIARELARVPF